MAETKGSKIKFYSSKTKAEAAALATTEPGSVFFTNEGIILNGKIYAEPNLAASDIVKELGTTPVNRATADASGNNIANTYAKKADALSATATAVNGISATLGGTVANPTLSVAVSKGSIAANNTGVVTGGDVKTALDGKVDKVSGKDLSTHDFTNALKTKLEGIAEGATKITVDSALSATSTNPVQNKAVKADLDKKVVAVSGTTDTAPKAVADGDGNTIATTYAKITDISGLSGAMHLRGIADNSGDTKFSDNLTTNPVKVAGANLTAIAGDVVVQAGMEYVWTGAKWAKLGDDASYLLKNATISATNTTAGITVTLGGTASNPTVAVAVSDGSAVDETNMDVVTGSAVDSAIKSAVAALDKTVTGASASKTLASLTEVDGIIAATFQDISIAQSQVSGLATALAGKQASLSTDQLAAVNSGITAAKLTALETNAAKSFVETSQVKTATGTSATDVMSQKAITDALGGKVNTTTTVNGHALSGNVTVTKSDVGLGNVGNFKAVSTVANQGLTDAEKAAARANIGAGSSSVTVANNLTTTTNPTTTALSANQGKVLGDRTQKMTATSTNTTFTGSGSTSDVIIGEISSSIGSHGYSGNGIAVNEGAVNVELDDQAVRISCDDVRLIDDASGYNYSMKETAEALIWQ